MKLFYKQTINIFYLVIILLLSNNLCAQLVAESNDYIPPTISNPDGATIEWQTDGSVKVTGGKEVVFTSGIKKYVQNSTESYTNENEMLLINPQVYLGNVGSIYLQPNIRDDSLLKLNEKNKKSSGVDDSNGLFSKHLVEGGSAQVELFRRSAKIVDDPSNTKESNFMFDFTEDDYLVYGTKTKTELNANFKNQEEAYNSYGYYWSGFNARKSYVSSTDYIKLWNKPRSATWWDTAASVGVGLTVGVLVVGAVIVAAPEAAAAAAIASEVGEGSAVVGEGAALGETEGLLEGGEVSRTTNPRQHFEIQQGDDVPDPDSPYLKSLLNDSFYTKSVRSIRSFFNFSKYITKRNAIIAALGTGAAAAGTSAYYTTPLYRYYEQLTADFSTKEVLRKPKGDLIQFPIPAKLPVDNINSSFLNKEIDKMLINKVPCNTVLSGMGFTNCYNELLEPAVIKLTIKDEHLKFVNVPGEMSANLTPYQLFMNKQYTFDPTGHIIVTNMNSGDLLVTEETNFTRTQILPKNKLQTLNTEIHLHFKDFSSNNNEFYLVSKGKPVFGDQIPLSIIDLGKYGTLTDVDGNKLDYNLYKISLHKNRNYFVLTTTAEGPFLVGDNILLSDSENLAGVTLLRGINYSLRPIAKFTDWKPESGFLARYVNDIEGGKINSDFNILNCRITDDRKYQWEIAFPRQLKHYGYGSPIRDNKLARPSYGTNIAVYPSKEGTDNVIYLVATSPEIISNMDLKEVSLTQERVDTALTDVTDDYLFQGQHTAGNMDTGGDLVSNYYYLYKLVMKDSNRVLLRNINPTHGPFPLGKGGLITKSLQETEINKKFINKASIKDENERYMVAWHRGSWKNTPENSIASINAANGYNLLEMDLAFAKINTNPVSREWDKDNNGKDNSGLDPSTNLPYLVLFHDPFMFRVAYKPDLAAGQHWDSTYSIGPDNLGCVQPYDKMMMPWILTQRSNKELLLDYLGKQWENSDTPVSRNELADSWLQEPSAFTINDLRGFKLRDRFGCKTNETIPEFKEVLKKAIINKQFLSLDKGEKVMDAAYWYALEENYEDNIAFKDVATHTTKDFANLYGFEFFKQTAYTPWIFEENAETTVSKIESWISAESIYGWHIPGFEAQVKMRSQDAINFSQSTDIQKSHGFFKDGNERLLTFINEQKPRKWIGVTQVTPTSGAGFDNKFLYMNSPDAPIAVPGSAKELASYQIDKNYETPTKSVLDPKYQTELDDEGNLKNVPKLSDPLSSRWDRRADFLFNIHYLKADYWITDRPVEILRYLKAIGKNVIAPNFEGE